MRLRFKIFIIENGTCTNLRLISFYHIFRLIAHCYKIHVDTMCDTERISVKLEVKVIAFNSVKYVRENIRVFTSTTNYMFVHYKYMWMQWMRTQN